MQYDNWTMTSTQERLSSADGPEKQEILPTALAYREGKLLPQFVGSVIRARLGLPGYVNERVDLLDQSTFTDEGVIAKLEIDTLLPDMIDEQEFLDQDRKNGSFQA